MPVAPTPNNSVGELIHFGAFLLVLEAALFLSFIINLGYIGNVADAYTSTTAGDALYVLVLTTSHFFTNTAAVAELYARLTRTRTEFELSETSYLQSDLSWTPALFLVPLFIAALDATNVVRACIYHHESRIQFHAVFTQVISVLSFLWSFYIAYWLRSWQECQAFVLENAKKKLAEQQRASSSGGAVPSLQERVLIATEAQPQTNGRNGYTLEGAEYPVRLGGANAGLYLRQSSAHHASRYSEAPRGGISV
jgi:hypothetical protein